jgi:hypothetical protein
MIRAGHKAVSAADATWIDVCDNAVRLVARCGVHRTDKRAGRMVRGIAVHTGSWKVSELIIWIILAVLELINLHPGD